MKPDLIAARVAEVTSGALLFVGAYTLDLRWGAVGFGLYVACGWLIHRASV